MPEEDAAALRREARLCRSLEAVTEDDMIRTQLRLMADEYLARALEIERNL